MSEIVRDGTSVLMAIVGVAIIAVLVSNSSNTTNVLKSASSGFGGILQVAMGGAAGSGSILSNGN